MMALADGTATAILVAWVFVHRRQMRAPVRRLRSAPTQSSAAIQSRMTRWGVTLLRVCRVDPSRFTAAECRWSLAAVTGALCILWVSAPLALLCIAIAGVVMLRQPVRRAQRRQRNIVRELPDVVDMFQTCIASGFNVVGAMRATSASGNGVVAVAMKDALLRLQRGSDVDNALEQLVAATSSDVRRLTSALQASAHYGVPLSTSLTQLAFELRTEQTRRSEIAARRLSVQLLFPVACCTLPAFALLAVAPLIAGSLSGLATAFH
jgi:Flp pilus assembly protein TadB